MKLGIDILYTCIASISTAVIIVVIIVAIGIFIEHLFHKDYGIKELINSLKQDTKTIIGTFFEPVYNRHQFDTVLTDDIRIVLKEYVKNGFEVGMKTQIYRDVPMIWIRYVPKNALEKEDMEEVVNYVLLKFREYIEYYGFHWDSFGSYSSGAGYMNIYVYYAENPNDEKALSKLYHRMIRKNSNKSYGVIRDLELDEELLRIE